jgi:glycosyltransferase involved in cell wall biosynthesis
MLHLLTLVSASLAWLLTLHTAINTKFLLTCNDTSSLNATVDILIPARNEETSIQTCVRAALNQSHVSNVRVVVLNDNSTDHTLEQLHALRAELTHLTTDSASELPIESNTPHHERLVVINSTDEPQDGWLGKTWACARLANTSTAEYLVFIDADVVLSPTAVVSAINALNSSDMHVISPYPRQVTHGLLGRLIQPLLQWSWLTTVPLKLARSTTRPSLAVANGQFLVCRRLDYETVGGHASVKSAVLDDIELLRSFYKAGLNGTVVDGTHIATCTMYETDRDLINGYAKSLWTAFGGAVGSCATIAFLKFVYVWPLFAIVTADWKLGVSALLAGVVGRIIVAARTKQHVLPDVALHSLSIIAFGLLNTLSWWRHFRHHNQWKGRAL